MDFYKDIRFITDQMVLNTNEISHYITHLQTNGAHFNFDSQMKCKNDTMMKKSASNKREQNGRTEREGEREMDQQTMKAIWLKVQSIWISMKIVKLWTRERATTNERAVTGTHSTEIRN